MYPWCRDGVAESTSVTWYLYSSIFHTHVCFFSLLMTSIVNVSHVESSWAVSLVWSLSAFLIPCVCVCVLGLSLVRVSCSSFPCCVGFVVFPCCVFVLSLLVLGFFVLPFSLSLVCVSVPGCALSLLTVILIWCIRSESLCVCLAICLSIEHCLMLYASRMRLTVLSNSGCVYKVAHTLTSQANIWVQHNSSQGTFWRYVLYISARPCLMYALLLCLLSPFTIFIHVSVLWISSCVFRMLISASCSFSQCILILWFSHRFCWLCFSHALRKASLP